MKRKAFTPVVCLLAALVFMAVGCGKKKTVGSGDAAFQSAAPEIKAAWNAAMAAVKTNGYAAAILTLQQMRAVPGLSPAQAKAVDDNSTAISDAMYAAANKDDPAAKKAIDDLRNAMRR